jgi:hypothetical protein
MAFDIVGQNKFAADRTFEPCKKSTEKGTVSQQQKAREYTSLFASTLLKPSDDASHRLSSSPTATSRLN